GERVAHLHRRPLLLALLVERLGGHGGAVDAVAAGAASHVEDGIAGAARPGVEDVVTPGHAEREGVDQDVAVVAAVEPRLATHGGDAHAVAVAADAAHHAVDEEAHAGRVDFAET